MRLLFIRHGDPDYQNDCLNEIGIEEAKALAALAPALDLGMDVPTEAFLKAIRAHSLGYAVCVGFAAGDANFIRGLHRLAAEHGIRARFRLLVCGASLTPETLAALPLDLPDNRAAAVAEWMVDTWAM